MSIKVGLRTILINDTAVAAIVAARISPTHLKQSETIPAITYQRVSTGREYLIHEGPIGQVSSRIQYACWAETDTEAEALADAVRLALDGYSGLSGSMTIESVNSEGQWDFYDEKRELYCSYLNFLVQYKESP